MRLLSALLVPLLCIACDAALEEVDLREESAALPCGVALPFASEVVSFDPGPNAGFGEDKFPDVVLGPPLPGPPTSGSLDVLTLGVGGEIILGFGDRLVVDGPGPDFIVWENPFWQGGDPMQPFAELGEISVSMDLEVWHTFECSGELDGAEAPGCAGWNARQPFELCDALPLKPEVVGGDPFDLSELGLEEARFVRIRDLSSSGEGITAGFDLDAVGAIHLEDLP